jgi:hypothetical protein
LGSEADDVEGFGEEFGVVGIRESAAIVMKTSLQLRSAFFSNNRHKKCPQEESYGEQNACETGKDRGFLSLRSSNEIV